MSNNTNQPKHKVCVYTVLFGGFDSLRTKPLYPEDENHANIPFYVITDEKSVSTSTSAVSQHVLPHPWKALPTPVPAQYQNLEKESTINPRKIARHYKLLPPAEIWDNCQISVYVDASVDLKVHPGTIAARLDDRADLGLVRHPFCPHYKCEMEWLCIVYPHDCSLYRGQAMGYVAKDDFDVYSKTYETCFMVRRHTEQVRGWMGQWMQNILSSGHLRDQMALVPTLHRNAVDFELPKYSYSLKGAAQEQTTSIQEVPSFIQVYKGHNNDFVKWRCHAKVMGQKRDGLTHAAYCTLYYVVKRYFPWVEGIAPVAYTVIDDTGLKTTIGSTISASLFVLLALVVFFPQIALRQLRKLALRVHKKKLKSQSILDNRDNYKKRGWLLLFIQSLQISVVGSCLTGCFLATMYTFALGLFAAWAGVLVVYTPIVYCALLVRKYNSDAVVVAGSKNNIEAVSLVSSLAS